MVTLILYLVCATALLLASVVIFRVLFRRDFQQVGELSHLSLVLGALVFFLWGGFPYIYGIEGWPAVRVVGLVEVAGKLLLFGGLVVMIGSMIYLGVIRSFGRQQTALIQRGPYSLSRNPQVVGVVLYGAGFALLWPSWYALGWFILLLLMVHMMVLSEEEHLERVFREQYAQFRARVPRYIGRARLGQLNH